MVNLLEYQGKALFTKYGISVPKSYVAKTPAGLKRAHRGVVFIKAQVPTGGRGKSGGVVKAKTYNEAKKVLKKMTSEEFNGFKPEAFLVEDRVEHEAEVYMSVALDRTQRLPVFIVSKKGGVDIEQVPREELNIVKINPMVGLREYQKRSMFDYLDIHESLRKKIYALLDAMWAIYTEKDAELVEINPVGITDDGPVALDAKVVIDDDALFRHKEFQKELPADKIERTAKEHDISFVRLGGDIGLIANGAGLTMATIDRISDVGGSAGDFLDLGGTDDPDRVAEAIRIVSEAKPKALVINIFGGVTKADTVANGIINAVKKYKPRFGIFVRLSGFNKDEGKLLLKQNGIMAFDTSDDAINAAVSATRGQVA